MGATPIFGVAPDVCGVFCVGPLLCDVFLVPLKHVVYMGESFQDYSWIQDFEDDFPQKVILKMLN